MKKNVNYFWPLLAVALMVSCKKITGEGPFINTTRNMPYFSGIISSLGQKVNVVQDTASFVEIKAQQNILDVLETFISGDNLILKIKKGFIIGKNQDIAITIHTPALKYLELDGSGYITVKDTANSDNLKCNLSGSGSIQLENILIQNSFTGAIDGSGNILIKGGTARNANFECNSSGGINSTGLAAENVRAVINGSGTIKVMAVKSLNANINGSGTVYYTGNPALLISVSGSGSVKPI